MFHKDRMMKGEKPTQIDNETANAKKAPGKKEV